MAIFGFIVLFIGLLFVTIYFAFAAWWSANSGWAAGKLGWVVVFGIIAMLWYFLIVNAPFSLALN